jgi:uncharacterized Zn-finger protein
MNFIEPSWFLKQVCPYCEQGSSLSFNTCEECKSVVLICIEEGSLFPNPNDLLEIQAGEDNNCPYCQKLDSFRLSTSHEIQSLGFKPGEYA